MKYRDIDFLYSSAFACKMEANLISYQDFVKAIEMSSLDEVFKSIGEYPVLSSHEELGFEGAIEKDLLQNYIDIEENTHNSGITRIFRWADDGHNIKVFLKNRKLGISDDSMYKSTGVIALDELKSALLEAKQGNVPDIMWDAINRATEILAKSSDVKRADSIIDKAVVELMKQDSDDFDNDLIKAYVERSIDFMNASIMLRFLKQSRPVSEVSFYLLPGGSVSDKIWQSAYSSSYDGIGDVVRSFDTTNLCGDEIAEIRNGGAFSNFEKCIPSAVLDSISQSVGVGFGIERVLWYLGLKHREVKSARLVVTGKMFELPNEEIAKRLEVMYEH